MRGELPRLVTKTVRSVLDAVRIAGAVGAQVGRDLGRGAADGVLRHEEW